jgi:hypothetical protein
MRSLDFQFVEWSTALASARIFRLRLPSSLLQLSETLFAYAEEWHLTAATGRRLHEQIVSSLALEVDRHNT